MKTKTLKRKLKAQPGGSLEPVGSAPCSENADSCDCPKCQQRRMEAQDQQAINAAWTEGITEYL